MVFYCVGFSCTYQIVHYIDQNNYSSKTYITLSKVTQRFHVCPFFIIYLDEITKMFSTGAIFHV